MKKNADIWAKNGKDSFFDEFYEGSMYGCLKRMADTIPDYTAMEFEGKKTSYKELMEQIDLCAKGLLVSDVKKGDYITIVTPNTPMAIIFVYAANRIGAVCNMLHPMLSQEEIKKFIEDTNSKVIVTLDQIYAKFRKYEWKEGFDPLFVLTPIADALPGYKAFFYKLTNRVTVLPNHNHRICYWKDFMIDPQVALPADEGKADDPAVIMYSGGTTGVPKGCVTTNLSMNALAYGCYDTCPEVDVRGYHSLALMPVFHSFGLGISIHSMLCMGMHLFVLAKYDMAATTKLIFDKKISMIYGVPALFQAISRSEEIEKADLSFMKHLVSGGDRLPISLINRMNKYLEKGGSTARLLEAYGQTENNAGGAMNTYFNYKAGSFGIAFEGLDMKLFKLGTHEEAVQGESGEICLSGPLVMKEYLNNPEETARALQVHEDGKTWLHTSDLAHQDEDGYFYFDGRASRMIITAGYNVYPQELERIIDEMPMVSASCVIGVGDTAVGQRVRAYIVLSKEAVQGEEKSKEVFKERIIEHLRENVAEYAMPVEYIFKTSLPMTSLGKVDAKAIEKEANNAQ